MSIGSTLQKNVDFEPWLDSAKARNAFDFYFWERYQKLLVAKGFSARVLAPFDNVTDRTLGLLENPKREGKWDRRGMVVGHVQSGKTANYTGLVCKAADAGYKVIIVIAGIHNNLRSQTQMRLDEGFTGFDSARLLSNQPDTSRVIGVGRYDSRASTECLHEFITGFQQGDGNKCRYSVGESERACSVRNQEEYVHPEKPP